MRGWLAVLVGLVSLSACSVPPTDVPDGGAADALPPDVIFDVETVRVRGTVALPAPCEQYHSGQMTSAGELETQPFVATCDGSSSASFDQRLVKGLSSGTWVSIPEFRGLFDPFEPIDRDRDDLAFTVRNQRHEVRGVVTLDGAVPPVDCASNISLFFEGVQVSARCENGKVVYLDRVMPGEKKVELGWTPCSAGICVRLLSPRVVVDRDATFDFTVTQRRYAGTIIETGGSVVCAASSPRIELRTVSPETSFSTEIDCSSGTPTFSLVVPSGRYQPALLAGPVVALGDAVDVTSDITDASFGVRWVPLDVGVVGLTGPLRDVVCKLSLSRNGLMVSTLKFPCSSRFTAAAVPAGTYDVAVSAARPGVTNVLLDSLGFDSMSSFPVAGALVLDGSPVDVSIPFVPFTTSLSISGKPFVCPSSPGIQPSVYFDLVELDRGYSLRWVEPCAGTTTSSITFTRSIPPGRYRIALYNGGTRSGTSRVVDTATSASWTETLSSRPLRIAVRLDGELVPTFGRLVDGGGNEYRLDDVFAGDYTAELNFEMPQNEPFWLYHQSTLVRRPITVLPLP